MTVKTRVLDAALLGLVQVLDECVSLMILRLCGLRKVDEAAGQPRRWWWSVVVALQTRIEAKACVQSPGPGQDPGLSGLTWVDVETEDQETRNQEQ